jgi:hypothetical protein
MLAALPTEAQQSVEEMKERTFDLLQPLIKSNLINQQKVSTAIDAAALMVFNKAKQGATQKLTPILIGVLAVSGIAAVLSGVAIAQARKARKGR